MPKSSSNNLFILIKSLSKQEKKQVRTFALKTLSKNEKNYIKLFEILVHMDAFDEKKLIQRIRRERFSRYLPRVTNYLYEIILKALHVLYLDSDRENRIKKMLSYANILYMKGLLPQAKKILLRAENEATENELTVCELEAYDLHEMFLYYEISRGRISEDYRVLAKKRNLALNNYKNIQDYSSLNVEFHGLYARSGAIREEKVQEQYKAFFCHPALADENQALTYRSRLYYHTMHAGYAMLAEPLLTIYYHLKKILQILEGNTGNSSSDTLNYLDKLNTFASICLQLGKYEEGNEAFNTIRSFSLNFPCSGLLIHRIQTIIDRSYFLEIAYYFSSRNFEKGTQMIPAVEKILEKKTLQLSLSDFFAISYFLSYLYYLNGNSVHSLLYLNKIINEKNQSIRVEILSWARIMNLIIHYELGNQELLEYSVGSVYRFLTKKQNLYKTEKCILDFIRKELRELTSPERLISSLIAFKEKLIEITNDPYEHNLMEIFDLISWLESKITGRPFREILGEKVNR